MYNNSTAKIKINKLLSPKFDINKGTEQGHPMSPELFKLYISDLSDSFDSIGNYPHLIDTLLNHLLWADDLVLLALDNDSLQKNLNILYSYCEKWDLTINMKKTKIITFNKRTQNEFVFKIGNNTVEHAKTYCYLGVVFHSNGNFKSALNDLRGKSLRALFGLKRVINKQRISFDALMILFDSLIKPALLYGCQVFIPYLLSVKKLLIDPPVIDASKHYFNILSNDCYDKFHIRFLKWALGVHRKSSNLGSYGDTGRYPIIFNAIKISSDYFTRVTLLDPDRLVHKAYLEQQRLELDWFTNSSKILALFGNGMSPRMSTNVIRNLQFDFIKYWKLGVESSPKLDFYKTLKSDFSREKYLKLKNYDYRRALSKIRFSAHNFEIERGRYTTPITPRSERFCKFCLYTTSVNVIECERHILFNCPLYRSIRDRSNLTTNDVTIEILKNSDNYILLEDVGRLCSSILDTHQAFNSYLTTVNDNSNSPNNNRCKIL